MDEPCSIEKKITNLLLAAGGNNQNKFAGILGDLLRELPAEDDWRNMNFLTLIKLAGGLAADAALSPDGTRRTATTPITVDTHREQSRAFLRTLVEAKFRTRAQYWPWFSGVPNREWVAWSVSLTDGSSPLAGHEALVKTMELSANQELRVEDLFAMHAIITMLFVEELYENPEWWNENTTLRDAAAACVGTVHTYALTHTVYDAAAAEKLLADTVNKQVNLTPSDSDISAWIEGDTKS